MSGSSQSQGATHNSTRSTREACASPSIHTMPSPITSDPGYPAPDLPLLHSGKVRDTYQLPGGDLLMVASDRISTYDAVHPTTIHCKGKLAYGAVGVLV